VRRAHARARCAPWGCRNPRTLPGAVSAHLTRMCAGGAQHAAGLWRACCSTAPASARARGACSASQTSRCSLRATVGAQQCEVHTAATVKMAATESAHACRRACRAAWHVLACGARSARVQECATCCLWRAWKPNARRRQRVAVPSGEPPARAAAAEPPQDAGPRGRFSFMWCLAGSVLQRRVACTACVHEGCAHQPAACAPNTPQHTTPTHVHTHTCTTCTRRRPTFSTCPCMQRA
jgi:hypothetical protein